MGEIVYNLRFHIITNIEGELDHGVHESPEEGQFSDLSG